MKYTERLKELREDNDLSQREVAEYLNCSQTAYGKWENGQRDITIENLIKLAKLYKVSLDYIAGLTNKKNTEWNVKNNVNISHAKNIGKITIK